ncbi:hypothetical protein RIF29_11533 [Crotalaria pallida]|uniref:Uncharacterized protein n=1 Tax=Crotalaria pallida TaxID=3830 RepID=A0AAN9IME3_CROPI
MLAWNLMTSPDASCGLLFFSLSTEFSILCRFFGMHFLMSLAFRGLSSKLGLLLEEVVSGFWVKLNFGRTYTWIPGGIPSLASLSDVNIPMWCDNYPVIHYSINGEWDWSVLNNILPRYVCEKIAVVIPPNHSAGADSI